MLLYSCVSILTLVRSPVTPSSDTAAHQEPLATPIKAHVASAFISPHQTRSAQSPQPRATAQTSSLLPPPRTIKPQQTSPRSPSQTDITAMEDTAHSLCSQIHATNKVFRLACSQVILLNNKIEEVKARYDRARADRRLSFRFSNRLKLTSLEGVRNLIYEYACVKCEEIEALQIKLREVTGQESDHSDDAASETTE